MFCFVLFCCVLFFKLEGCRTLFFFNNFYFYFYLLFMAVLGLHLCARAFSSCGKRRPLSIAARGPLTIAASPVAEHRLQTRRPSNCSPRAQPLRGMWDLPRPGHEPVSPALAGRLPTTAPPGKPLFCFLIPSTGRSDLAKCEYDDDLAKCGPLKSNMAPLDTRGRNQQAGAFLAFREENEIISSLDF